MGYLIHYSFHNVRIPASQVTAALAAIHDLYQPEMVERMGTATIYDHTTKTMRKCYRGGQLPSTGSFVTLMDALQEWSLGSVQQSDSSIEIVEYRCDKAGDESVLFDARPKGSATLYAPFLDYSCNSRVDAFQDNNEHWRHVFMDGQHRQVPGKVIFADQHPELFDSLEN
jgi:hypothetical protein